MSIGHHDKESHNSSMLAFHLRSTVRYIEKENSIYLILNYPLKAIILDLRWKPVFNALGGEEFVLFKDIVPMVDNTNPEQVLFFLNDLVRKGFLESNGYLNLNEYPSVSIIIPVRNRPEAIYDCLESIKLIDYPEDKLEILVVDDASDDNTPDVVSDFPVQLIRLKKHSQASFCRNIAADRANGEILAFLDSDCIADCYWLKEIITVFMDPETGAVGGLVDSYYNKNGLDRYEKVRSSLNIGHRPKSSREGDLFFYVPSCNLLVRQNVFLDLGGFKEDQSVGEDVDFCWRLQDHGYHLEYRPSGRVYHKHRNRFRYFCARRFDYGTSEPLLQQSHENRVKRFFLPILASAFWSIVFLSFLTGLASLMILCVMVFSAECVFTFAVMYKKNIPIHFLDLIIANLRSYVTLLYHLCAFVSRYYLCWSFPFLFLMPIVSLTILGMHLVTCVVEYVIKKPGLDFPFFFLLFTLDQLFYQLGVWWGCIKRHFFGPVNPRIIRKPFSGELL